MIIQGLTIRNYRGVEEMKLSFPRSVVLPPESAEAVLKAIGIILNSETVAGAKEEWGLEENSELVSKIDLQDETLYVRVSADRETRAPVWDIANDTGPVSTADYFNKIHIPPAEEKENCYLANRPYREVLDSYREPEKYYSPKEFSRATEGIGNTAVFRQAVLAKIREHKKMGPEKMDNLQLFVKVNTLWQMVQAVRDLHHEGHPVFIFEKPQGSGGRQIIKALKQQVFFVF